MHVVCLCVCIYVSMPYVHITESIWKILRARLKREMVVLEISIKPVCITEYNHGYVRF